jgi:hypothetical protein
MHGLSAILEQVIHDTYINSNKYIMHIGIPYNEEELLLYGIEKRCWSVISFLIKNNFLVKNYYMFKAVDAEFWNLLADLLYKGADPFFEYNGENLFQYIIKKSRPNEDDPHDPFQKMMRFLEDNRDTFLKFHVTKKFDESQLKWDDSVIK